jgi:DNA-binding response OmpR family regulator
MARNGITAEEASAVEEVDDNGPFMRRALVVEDDPDIVELLTHFLQQDGWAVDVARDGRAALERLRKGGIELLLLDLQIPLLDGLGVCSAVRADPQLQALPVVMLTARGDETDRILGLEMGADDYIVKPFSPKELLARIRALFRRIERAPSAGLLTLGELRIDRERHTVHWGTQAVTLTAKEFALLVALLEAKGRVLSRQQLLEDVWGYSYAEGTRTVDVHVRRLREKLPGLAPKIVTVKSLGYRLAADGTD